MAQWFRAYAALSEDSSLFPALKWVSIQLPVNPGLGAGGVLPPTGISTHMHVPPHTYTHINQNKINTKKR